MGTNQNNMSKSNANKTSWPPVDQRLWGELSDDQRKLALTIGYTPKNYDSGDTLNLETTKEFNDPPIKWTDNSDWADIPIKVQKQLELMGYNERIWDVGTWDDPVPAAPAPAEAPAAAAAPAPAAAAAPAAAPAAPFQYDSLGKDNSNNELFPDGIYRLTEGMKIVNKSLGDYHPNDEKNQRRTLIVFKNRFTFIDEDAKLKYEK